MKTFVAVLALAAVVAADNGATKHVHPKADPHPKQIYYDSKVKKDVHTTYHEPVHHQPAYHPAPVVHEPVHHEPAYHPEPKYHEPVHHAPAPAYHEPVHKPEPVYHAEPVHHEPAYHPAPVVHKPVAVHKPAYHPAPKPHGAPSYHEPQYKDGPAHYHYAYGVEGIDGYKNKVHFGAEENRDDYDTKGSYHVLLPDGRTQTVNYHVGDAYSGYVADVQYSGNAYAPAHHEPVHHAPVHHA